MRRRHDRTSDVLIVRSEISKPQRKHCDVSLAVSPPTVEHVISAAKKCASVAMRLAEGDAEFVPSSVLFIQRRRAQLSLVREFTHRSLGIRTAALDNLPTSVDI